MDPTTIVTSKGWRAWSWLMGRMTAASVKSQAGSIQTERIQEKREGWRELAPSSLPVLKEPDGGESRAQERAQVDPELRTSPLLTNPIGVDLADFRFGRHCETAPGSSYARERRRRKLGRRCRNAVAALEPAK